jgi:ABC-type glycerol-3-phosphate transport system substrate-binding protein
MDFYQKSDSEDTYIVSTKIIDDKLLVLMNATSYEKPDNANKDVIPENQPEEVVTPGVEIEETTVMAAPEETSNESEQSDVADAIETEGVSTEEISDEENVPVTISKYYILNYSLTGELLSQTSMENVAGENTSVLSLEADNDGNLTVLSIEYDMKTDESKLFETGIDTSGKIIKGPVECELKSDFSASSVFYDDLGNRYYLGYKDKPTIVVTDSSGRSLFEISDTCLYLNMYKMNGKVYTDGYNAKNNSYTFFEIDIANKKLGKGIDMSFIKDADMGLLTGPDGLYYETDKGISKVDLENKKTTEIVAWNDCDYGHFGYGDDTLVILSDSSFIAFSSVYDYENLVFNTTPYLMTKESENPNVGKKIITVGGTGITYDINLKKRIYEFNKANNEYRIEAKDYEKQLDYSAYKTEDEYMQAYSDMINQMNVDIVSGNGPDILYGNLSDYTIYESKGLLVDMYSLMEGDESFNKGDLLPGILKACETDGKLYKMSASFYINGLVGAKSIIGDRAGWTMDEFEEVAKSLPEEMSLLSLYGNSQTDLLTSVLSTSMGTFVDKSSGTVRFDTDEFREILKMAKEYGRDDDAIDDGSYWVADQDLIRNKELAITTAYIDGLNAYHEAVSAFGEPVSFVGYPSPQKQGPSCVMLSMLAISSESSSVEASWSFVKSFFTEEAQDNYGSNWEIPVLRSSLEKSIQDDLHPDTESYYYYEDDTQGPPVNEESAEGYRALVENVSVFIIMDPAIMSIVQEEVPPYFNDQKTAEDVSKLIQNRVETIVKEKR